MHGREAFLLGSTRSPDCTVDLKFIGHFAATKVLQEQHALLLGLQELFPDTLDKRPSILNPGRSISQESCRRFGKPERHTRHLAQLDMLFIYLNVALRQHAVLLTRHAAQG